MAQTLVCSTMGINFAGKLGKGVGTQRVSKDLPWPFWLKLRFDMFVLRVFLCQWPDGNSCPGTSASRMMATEEWQEYNDYQPAIAKH